MNTYIPISLKRLATQQLVQVRRGQVTRDQAEELLKRKVRHSSKLREDLIAGLTKDYDREAVEALEYFRLI